MSLQPRRRYVRGPKVTFRTLPPLKPRPKTAQPPKECSTTDRSPGQMEKTTGHPPARGATWWPSGVHLGSRPPRTHLPLHVINPSLFKWERKLPKIWFRTGGTRYTYAPEVVNYPVSFNWSIPKDKRVDKYTAKPDWPLNSPLFGSNEIYDYLEEVTLPAPPVSGETELPKTTPQPWWTFPPWWEKKVLKEEKYGNKIKPQEAQVFVKPTVPATAIKNTNTPLKITTNTKTSKAQVKCTPSSSVEPITTKSVHKTLIPATSSVTNKVHHTGPWWKLTFVEHRNQQIDELKRNIEEGERMKRSIYKYKPLVRQNAFRRKRKDGFRSESRNNTFRIMKQNKNCFNVMKKTIKLPPVPYPEANEEPIVNRTIFRKKRNIGAINNYPDSQENINIGKDDINIDKEISALKKSSLSDVEKIRKLKKRLKWLQSQTENPSNIVFPEHFEEMLMITENYDDDKPKVGRLTKTRYQWSVRTKKPTLKTVTFLPKIRLARGKIFVPLTTTEEQLVIPKTLPPATKVKKSKSAVSRKKVKRIDSLQKSTLRPTIRRLLQRTKAPVKTTVDHTNEIKPMRKLTRKHIVTSFPGTTFATVRSFKTMKFGKSTQKEVISLQEFLKRRNEHRRVKEEVMWNKNFSFTSGETVTTKKTPLQDMNERKEYVTDEDEEELSFEAKLSGEIKASDFTLRPLSHFLFTKPTQSLIKESKQVSDSSSLSLCEGFTHSSKEHETFTANRKRLPHKNKSSIISKTHKNTTQNALQSVPHRQVRNHSSLEGNGKRRKRNIIEPQRESSFTGDSRRSKTEEKIIEVVHGPTLDDSLIGAKQNISRHRLEQKIQNRSETRGDAVQCRNNIVEYNNSDSVSSFETYQQEHRKWFGSCRRGVPVNNFDIDWDQMRGKFELRDLSISLKQKEAQKLGGKEIRNYWDFRSTLNLGNEVTASTGRPSFAMRYKVPKNSKTNKNFEQRSSRYTQFATIKKPDENKHKRGGNIFDRDGLEPPYGKVGRNGRTAFGKLYEEPKKRHYRVFDNRDRFFDEKDINNVINNTYCADFRILTHRKTHWHNRTFDPNFIFTQNPTEQNWTPINFSQLDSEKLHGKFPKANVSHSNDPRNNPKSVDSEFHTYVNVLKENRFMPIRPKHQSFKDKFNNTVIINQDNATFILQRSKRIPLDNNTDVNAYIKYKNSRKRFYNKTIDIVFSYYIFHKFKSGNSTRDLGYGRVSNVVNRWYNRTFVPKYRPDMFYVHNRYKAGKELNFFRNEFNILHSMMSEGTFDSSKAWSLGHVTRNSDAGKSERHEITEKNEYVREKYPIINSIHNPPDLLQSSHKMSIRPSVRTLETSLKYKQDLDATAIRFRSPKPVHGSQYHSTMTPFQNITRKSFFKTVKDKGFVFLKSLFGITNKKNDASK